ncbi:MFS transporter [Pseudomonas sp. R5(2019)]|uniref:MFS transporter n=1 Tax=Pseudomonas sp. R5(2019) TaxID=2697566 RepID=UPI001413271D|nr:MFS transporter [Pseudomonas sp. R5(2019)]NBA98175.1 MFS transporter [Pseudomonas sp. R5(2019)]
MSKYISATAYRGRSLLLVLSVTVFFVGFTEFMLSSMLSPLAVAFETTSVGASWLVSSYALSYALAAPLFGYFSDRTNKRKLLLLALLFFAVDGLAVIYTPTLEVAIMFRVFGGIASAALIPTVFSLLSDLVPLYSQAGAMGVVMLGMTVGISCGPALAGVLTDILDWRAPFLLSSVGCLLTCVVGFYYLPLQSPPSTAKKPTFDGFRKWFVLRPVLAKAAWNGTSISAFLLSGEVLRQRYGFGPAEVGLTVVAFGVGLGLGNLTAGPLRKVCGREEGVLVLVSALLIPAVSIFMVLELAIWGSIVCLLFWGAALGAGAPLSTVVLAARAGPDKGVVLAIAETFNNLAILTVMPLATSMLVFGGAGLALIVILIGLGVGLMLTVIDFYFLKPNLSRLSNLLIRPRGRK